MQQDGMTATFAHIPHEILETILKEELSMKLMESIE